MSDFNIVIKVVFISVAITIIMYGLNVFEKIRYFFSSSLKIISKIPILDVFYGFFSTILHKIYSMLTMMYDKMGIYGMPDSPLPDDHYMY